jgi:uncharacterized protein (DUF952 family)
VRIFHIVAPEAWSVAQATGEYTPDGYSCEGFVHFSFAHQVAAVANASYRGEPDLIAIEVESDAVPAELRVEDCYESGQPFPHVYGPIPIAAVRGTTRLTRATNGDWEFTVPGDAAVPASTDQ